MTTTEDRPARRTSTSAMVIGIAMLAVVIAVVVGAIVATSGDDERRPSTAAIGPPPTYERPPLTQPEGWRPMAKAPLAGRANPVTAWTGSELLVWRGEGAFNDGGGGEPGRTDGAAYDPKANTWRPMADSPLPAPENVVGVYQYASAWTGRELLVWGGPGPKAAAYDPTADTWRSFDPGPLDERTALGSVWTGSELIVVGGVRPLRETDLERTDPLPPGEASAYDPTTDTWRSLPNTGVNRPGQAVWTGSRVLFLADAADGAGGPAVGLALDPRRGRWQRIAAPPLSRFTAPPVWTGNEVVAMGAAVQTDPARPSQGDSQAGAAVYDPRSDRWTIVATPGDLRLDQLVVPSAVWSGREVLVLGSPGFGSPPDQDVVGAAFDPGTRRWRRLPAPGLSTRGAMAAEWTGSELLVWGGAYSTGYTSDPLADGAIYRPGPGR